MPQPISQTVSSPVIARAPGRRNVLVLALLALAGCMVCFILLAALPDMMFGLETAEAFIASIVLTVMLAMTVAARNRGIIDARQQVLLMATLLFSSLIVVERVFFRYSTVGAAYQGDFPAGAYAEAMIWAICSAVLLLITFRNPEYLTRLFKPSFRWLSLLAFLSVASAAYSPSKAFSFVWGFKMLLAVLLLRVILDQIESMQELRWFLLATLWSFIALVVLILVQFVITPDPWEGGRTTEALSPTGVSTIAATLLLLGMTFYVEERKGKYLFYAGLGFCLMMLGGGKGAIVAALLAGTTFFILRKNLKQGLLFLIVTVVLGGILVAVTPLQRYLTDYAASGNAETGTGRLGLWELFIPAIMEKPLYGHGYLASRFIAEDLAGLDWPAGHTHNAFLEVLYNNGVIGLTLLVAVLWQTVRNLLWVVRRMRSGEMRTWAIGAFAILIFEFINGMLNASFGGRPASAYLLVLSILVISEVLAGLLQRDMLKSANGRFAAAVR